MIKYGKRKRRGSTIHPTGRENISKSTERFRSQEQAWSESFDNLITSDGFEDMMKRISQKQRDYENNM